MRVVAMIPARSGSKGVPNKNMYLLSGKPLLQYTIDSARDSRVFDFVYLNSDSTQYINFALDLGIATYKRPLSLATDNATMQSVVTNFANFLENISVPFDALMVLYPTYPLRCSRDITNVVDYYCVNQTSIIGVKQPKTHPYLCYTVTESGFLGKLIDFDENKFYRRQDYPVVYELTHWACVLHRKDIPNINAQLLCSTSRVYYVPEDRSINIDAEKDFEFAEFLLRKSESVAK